MSQFYRSLRWVLVLALLVSPAFAQEEGAEPDEEGEKLEQVEEVIVVTASRTEQRIHEVPAAVTVITAEDLETAPVDDFGDILRQTPGLNVSQISARDIQVTSRASTNSLAASQLVLLDGRSVYLDFFGFVMWDLLPINPREIKQVEVVQGPGSAVWGANAMSGVINVLTKAPREMQGTSILATAGELGTQGANVIHAQANDKWGFKVSGSYYEQDPYDRPTGFVPGTMTPYPAFENEGTKQPKIDLGVQVDGAGDSVWNFAAGYAGTDGIIHTGIGPFDIDSSTNLSYLKAGWTRRALQINLFANLVDGDADNLLTVGVDGQPLGFDFQTETYDLSVTNTSVLGENHILTYGGNARHNSFDLTLAPGAEDRDDVGVFLQDEILIGDKVRWLIGGRWDDRDPIGSVFSPRSSLLISPKPNHTLRLSYNEAFRAPSTVQNYLDVTILNIVPLPVVGPFVFPSLAVGNIDLEEETLTAVELGYVGTFAKRTTVSLSLYRNETENSLDFFTRSTYSGSSPPPGWPLPTFFLDFPPLAGALPSSFSYRNIGEIVDKGLELGVNTRPWDDWSFFLNYSYQADPDVEGISPDEINLPPRHRVNLGAAWDNGRYFVNGNVNRVDEAFWTDVLDSRFHGPTEAFTLANLSLGTRLMNERLTLSLMGGNIFDEDVQQHVFGDILSRKIVGQVIFDF